MPSTRPAASPRPRASVCTGSLGSPSWFIQPGPLRVSAWSTPSSTWPRTPVTPPEPSPCLVTLARPGGPPRNAYCRLSGPALVSPAAGSCSTSSLMSPRVPTRHSSTATSSGWSGRTACRPAHDSDWYAVAGLRPTPTSTTGSAVWWWSSTAGSATSSARTAGQTWSATSTVRSTVSSRSVWDGDRASRTARTARAVGRLLQARGWDGQAQPCGPDCALNEDRGDRPPESD